MAYSVATLAKKWECSPDTIYALINSGALQSFRLGRKRGIRIAEAEVLRWEESRHTQLETAGSPGTADIGLPTSVLAKIARVRG